MRSEGFPFIVGGLGFSIVFAFGFVGSILFFQSVGWMFTSLKALTEGCFERPCLFQCVHIGFAHRPMSPDLQLERRFHSVENATCYNPLASDEAGRMVRGS